MADHPTRRYTEEEIRILLGRAIEHQEAEQPHNFHDEQGLTLDEIQQIAAEVGVDPKHVLAAAAELDRPSALPETNRFLGGPVRVVHERIVEKRLSEADIAPLIATLRKHFPSKTDRVETLAGIVEWTSYGSSTTNIHLTAQPEDETTRLAAHQSFESLAILLHIWPVLLVVTSLIAFIIGHDVPSGVIIGSIATALYVAARFGYSVLTHRSTESMEAVLDRFVALASKPEPSSETTATAEQTESLRLDASLLEEDVPASSGPDLHHQARHKKRRE